MTSASDPASCLRPAAVGTALSGEQIGLIGVGLMGTALAERLLVGGFKVLGFDIHAARMMALRGLGGQLASGVGEIASVCRHIFLSLPDGEAVQEVFGGMAGRLGAGRTIIDTTTGCPSDAACAGRRLDACGVGYLEAPVLGSSSQTRQGDVVVVVGGPAQVFAECQNLFQLFARRTFHVGPWGSGSQTKLAANLVLGLNRAVLAKGLAFAGSLGLDPEVTLRILRESIAYSRIMDTKGGKMVGGDFEPEARLAQHLKDVRLILKAGLEKGARLPLSETHQRVLEQAGKAGLGALDNSAIIQVFEAMK